MGISHKFKKSVMKFYLFLILILVVFSCKKDEISLPIESFDSEFVNEYGQFQKELIVYDQSGENSLYLLLHSDYSGAIEHYLRTVDLSLELSVENSINNLKTGTVGNKVENVTEKGSIPPEILKRQVSIELITENIQENVEKYYLNVKHKVNKLKSDFIFHPDYCVTYKTSGDFIGVSNYGSWSHEDKWDIYCALEKTNSWLAGWDILWDGFLDGYLYDSYYWAWLDFTSTGNPYYKIGALLYTDPRVPTYNFLIAYNKNSFYGHTCSLGSYDTRNCYIGTAPSGTTAFMWPDAQGNFYYSPINGNECPYPGSSFDGANCYVVDIPSNCEGFIYNNSWYVKPDLIN